jgi:hypothetical protein
MPSNAGSSKPSFRFSALRPTFATARFGAPCVAGYFGIIPVLRA